MPQQLDYVPLDKLPALCRLLADDVGIPAHVGASILDSLMHWWRVLTEPYVLEELKGLFLLFPSSSASATLTERLSHLLSIADDSLANRTVELLRHFPSSTDASVAALMGAVTTRRGLTRWLAAMGLAELGVHDSLIIAHLQEESSASMRDERPIRRSAIVFDLAKCQSMYQAALSGSTASEKGRALEDLTEYIFLCIPGLITKARNLRTLAEEIDLAFSNSADGFWREIGNPFIVECKNLAEAVDARTLRDFRVKLQTMGLRGGFIVTMTRTTKDARVEMRQALSEGRVIVALEGEHLAAIAEGHDVGKILDDRFYACRLL